MTFHIVLPEPVPEGDGGDKDEGAECPDSKVHGEGSDGGARYAVQRWQVGHDLVAVWQEADFSALMINKVR